MSNPLISVIMPVYNAERFLRTAVESVLAQTYKNIEVICVNDCSADNSLSVLHSLSQSDKRIVVINSEINVGAGEARNLGIARATGEYITFVDADDTIEYNLYEKVVEKLEKTNADQVVWGILEKHYNASGKLIKTKTILPEEDFIDDEKSMTAKILGLEKDYIFGYQCNSFYRTDIIKKYNIKFEKAILYEDFFFNLEFARHMNTLAVLEFAGYNYFKRANTSITHGFVKDYFELSYRRIEEMCNFCSNRGYNNQMVYDIMGNRLLRYTFSALSRNHNPLSKMSFSDMRSWAYNLSKKPLYKELLNKCNPENTAHKILKILVLKRNAVLMVLIGKIVYSLKK